MKLSTRSRYGTRLLLDLAKHHEHGPIHLNDISKRQGISVKYLEQLTIPLRKAGLVKSCRGRKGGYLLKGSPKEISVGKIVRVLENGASLSRCVDSPESCDRVEACLTREIWVSATRAMYEWLDSITLKELVEGPAGSWT